MSATAGQRATPHADAMLVRLRDAGVRPYPPLQRASVDLANACRQIANGTDIVEAIGDMGAVVYAAERLADLARDLAKNARAALAGVMDEAGATSVANDACTVSLRRGAPTAELVAGAPVPDEFMTKPVPAPDRVAIAKALRGGLQANWATLSPGTLGITINPKAAK